MSIIFTELKDNFRLVKRSKQKFVDLGSGDGRVVIRASMAYEINALGIEIDERLVNDAKSTVKQLRKNKALTHKVARLIRFKVGDIFEQDLKKFDFIYIFSLPTMQKYLKHVFSTIKSSTIVISHRYPLEIDNSILKLESKLETKIDERSIYTYFYSKK
ncbi:MAG: class I SAM-dependent methyltransferase [Promethearchaeota archaeon]